MNEAHLVNQILSSNKKALNRFYKTYQQQLLNFIAKKIDNKKDAEEILQDTFMSAFDSLPSFSFKSSLLTWLCGIAKHEIGDFYRRKRIKTVLFSRLPFLERIVDKALGPELALQEKEAKRKIWQTFKNMSEGYVQILRLKYIDGCSVAQIAKILKTTIKAAESKLFRARVAFQKEYVNESQKSKVAPSPKLWSVGDKSQKLFKENFKIFNSSFDKRSLPF